MSPRRRMLRDIALFVTGLGLAIYEVVFRMGSERPTLIILIAGMLGLPMFLRADERVRNGPKPATNAKGGGDAP